MMTSENASLDCIAREATGMVFPLANLARISKRLNFLIKATVKPLPPATVSMKGVVIWFDGAFGKLYPQAKRFDPTTCRLAASRRGRFLAGKHLVEFSFQRHPIRRQSTANRSRLGSFGW